VIEAVDSGHRAAESIHRYLRGEELEPAPKPKLPVVDMTQAEIEARVAQGTVCMEPRVGLDALSMDERLSTFGEVVAGYSDEQARLEAARCLACGICSECLQCVYVCQKHCIDHEMQAQVHELQVGAVVLTPGLEVMPGDVRPEFGYGRLPNVVTSIEFERMLSATGPWGGEVVRPSDGEHPRKVAFIQCVGSRETPPCPPLQPGEEKGGVGYCSAVCCMYAVKEAVIAQEHDSNVAATVFYMDIRSYGKGFDRYVERAEQEYGVRYVRSMVSTVTDVPGTGNLRLHYASPDGNRVAEEFDLVVLSVGLHPPEDAQGLADCLGIELNEYGFAESPPLCPGQVWSKADGVAGGVFVAGPFSEPKDIPETVIEASCAAAQASALLAGGRGSLVEDVVYPPERDVSDEDVRVGVFVCHCGINIGGVVDVPDVTEYAAGLPGVAYVEHNLYTCSQDTQELIQERIEQHGLNRVVVASCTPRTHEPLFQATIRGAGLNTHLFEMTNIREQDSWVHRDNPPVATEKAKELTAMAVAKAVKLRPIERSTFEVDHRALVVGGGLAGMTAAISIAEQGFGVTLVERESELGGNLQHIYTALPDPKPGDPQALLQRTIEALSGNPRISVLMGAEVVDVGGYVGQFRTAIQLSDGQMEEISHGAIVVATGAQEVEPQEYLYAQESGVITQRELEAQIRNSEFAIPNSIVMIQCVGSRDDEHAYCSRICCTEAIKNALAVKEHSPETQVYVLYRDIRTFGFKERYYREARRQGVIFLRYDKEQKPEVVAANGQLRVDVVLQPEGERLALGADMVVLSAGIEPRQENDALGKLLKVPLDEDGFFLEAHVKLRPLDFAADGVYLCGMAHSPRFMEETISQAQGAAMRAVTLLSKSELEATRIVARVNPLLCSNCGLCVETCPYDARTLVPRPSPPLPIHIQGGSSSEYVQVIDVLCQGCGACVAICPNKASQQKGFEMEQVYGMLDAVAMN